MENKELLRKADLTMSDLESDGGLLNAEQSEKFIDMVTEAPTILRAARGVKMTRQKTEVNKLGFSSRILRPAVENTGLDADDRAKPSTGKVTLDTNEVIAEVRLPYASLEDNPEKESFSDHVMRLIAERVAVDLEELIVQGDTDNEDDAYLALFDGLIKRVKSHVVDLKHETGAEKSAFKQLVGALPAKYMQIRNQWRIYTSTNAELVWRDYLSDRATGAGDRFLLEDIPAPYAGIPVVPVSKMPEVAHDAVVEPPAAAYTSTTAILTHPQNILVGFHRNISVETDKDISARQYIIVVTCRVGMNLEEEDATAKLKDLLLEL